MNFMQSPRFLTFEIPKNSSNEHPSHTLFICNINPEVSDEAYVQLLESFGELESINFLTKTRGFIIATYFDIRNSKTAMKTLQKTIIGNKTLEVHFTISRAGNQINQGSIVVFNLDETITQQIIYEMFSQYGEIKDIRETPNKKHHKFIEFYDSRSAERALKQMNKAELNGKKLKIEYSRPGGKENGFITEDLIENFNSFERQRAQSDPGKCPGWGIVKYNCDEDIFPIKQRHRAQTNVIKSKRCRSSLISFQEEIDCETPQENSLFSRTPEQILSDNTLCSDLYDNTNENVCL